MSEFPPEEYRDVHFTFNDVNGALNRIGVYQGWAISMGNEQSGIAVVADVINPDLVECAEDMERAFPEISNNQWMERITDPYTRREAYTMASDGFVADLGGFIRALIPRKIAPYLDPQDKTAQGEFDIMSLELGEGIAVDIKATGYAWGEGEYVDHEVEVRAVFRRSGQTSSSR